MEIKTAGRKFTVTACIRTDADKIIPSPHIHKPCIPSGIQRREDAPVPKGGVAVYSGISPVKGRIIADPACEAASWAL